MKRPRHFMSSIRTLTMGRQADQAGCCSRPDDYMAMRRHRRRVSWLET